MKYKLQQGARKTARAEQRKAKHDIPNLAYR